MRTFEKGSGAGKTGRLWASISGRKKGPVWGRGVQGHQLGTAVDSKKERGPIKRYTWLTRERKPRKGEKEQLTRGNSKEA